MRGILAFVLSLAIGIVILGFYLDWFSFSTSRDAETGRSRMQFDVNENKIKSDTEKAKKKISGKDSKTNEKQNEK